MPASPHTGQPTSPAETAWHLHVPGSHPRTGRAGELAHTPPTCGLLWLPALWLTRTDITIETAEAVLTGNPDAQHDLLTDSGGLTALLTRIAEQTRILLPEADHLDRVPARCWQVNEINLRLRDAAAHGNRNAQTALNAAATRTPTTPFPLPDTLTRPDAAYVTGTSPHHAHVTVVTRETVVTILTCTDRDHQPEAVRQAAQWIPHHD